MSIYEERAGSGSVGQSPTMEDKQERVDLQNSRQQRMSRSLGFGYDSISALRKTTRGSEKLQSLEKAVLAEIKDIKGMNLNTFSREAKPELDFSFLVFDMKEGNRVYYFTALIAATGDNDMNRKSPGYFMNEVEMANNHPNQGYVPRLYTPDDGINANFYRVAKEVLTAKYGNVQLCPIDGIVIPDNDADVTDIARTMVAIAYNALYVDIQLHSGAVLDVNLAESLTSDSRLKAELTLNRSPAFDTLSNAVRSDFMLSVSRSAINKGQYVQLNDRSTSEELTRVHGFIDTIIDTQKINVPNTNNTEMIVVGGSYPNRAAPQIILTSVSSLLPTIGMSLMAIASAGLMVKPEMFTAVLANQQFEGKNTLGMVNLFTNINGSKESEVLDLNSKKLTQDDRYTLISKMYSIAPTISMDVPAFGATAYELSPFAVIGDPTKSASLKQSAAKAIIDAANTLTNGRFPVDFPTNEIILDDGVVVPLGTYENANREIRDIRDIDTSVVLSQTRDPQQGHRWLMSNTAVSRQSGKDPFLTKIDILNKIIPNATITGKAARITFTAKFLMTLLSAMDVVGYRPDWRAAANLPTTNVNDGFMFGTFNGARMDNVGGAFQQTRGYSGPNITTGYNTLGLDRSFR